MIFFYIIWRLVIWGVACAGVMFCKYWNSHACWCTMMLIEYTSVVYIKYWWTICRILLQGRLRIHNPITLRKKQYLYVNNTSNWESIAQTLHLKYSKFMHISGVTDAWHLCVYHQEFNAIGQIGAKSALEAKVYWDEAGRRDITFIKNPQKDDNIVIMLSPNFLCSASVMGSMSYNHSTTFSEISFGTFSCFAWYFWKILKCHYLIFFMSMSRNCLSLYILCSSVNRGII